MRRYPSKVILFGEYSVILGSQVLGVPLSDRFGYWSQEPGRNSRMTKGLIDYLLKECSSFLNENKIEEIGSGQIFYRSTIKRGYGTGSSGAISAAIYDYCSAQVEEHIPTLREQLAKIESFFHGKSSGFDPLISIKNTPILRDERGDYKLLNPRAILQHSITKIYLLDSGDRRRVKGLVPRFMEINKEKPSIGIQLTELNNTIITKLLADQNINADLAQLSAFQLEHMRPMVVDRLIPFWQEGLTTGDYFIKLCGTGGGGYYLIYMVNDEALQSAQPFQLVPLEGL